MKNKEIVGTEELKNAVIEAILDIKGHEVLELDLRDLTDAVSDYFIVCHGDSNTQVNAIANSVYKKIKDQYNLLPKSQEGKQNAEWIILDYFDVVVHIFYKETRQYYQLEELWSDAVTVEHE